MPPSRRSPRWKLRRSDPVTPRRPNRNALHTEGVCLWPPHPQPEGGRGSAMGGPRKKTRTLARPDGGHAGPRIGCPCNPTCLPSGVLPPPPMFLAVIDGSGQNSNRVRGKKIPRAGTAFTDMVPDPDSETEVRLQLLLRGTAPVGDSLRRSPEHLAGRARRCFEELLDRAASHMHLLWDRGKDTPSAHTPPVDRRKISSPGRLAKCREGAPAGAPSSPK